MKMSLIVMVVFPVLAALGCTSTSYQLAVHSPGFSVANMTNKRVFVLQPVRSQAASLDQPSGGQALGHALVALFKQAGSAAITLPADGIQEINRLGKLDDYLSLQSAYSVSGNMDSKELEKLASAVFSQGYDYLVAGMMLSDEADRLPAYRHNQGLDRSLERIAPNVEAAVTVIVLSARPEEGLVYVAHASHALNDDFGSTGAARAALTQAYAKAFAEGFKRLRVSSTAASGKGGYTSDRVYGD